MAAFQRLIRFQTNDDKIYFSDLGKENSSLPLLGSTIQGYSTIEELFDRRNGQLLTVHAILAAVPRTGIPIYCVGLNYRSHAKEASLPVPKYPPLWTKPAAALANSDSPIHIGDFCASSLPDYEGELVFVTSRTVKDVSVKDAEKAILGYTVGNDLSCRLFQLPSNQSGQFFFAKAFDNFAPIGPVLVNPDIYEQSGKRLITKVNGQIMQDTVINEDMIFEPARILSHMSQGTTIPAYTPVMTGTAAGVGAFCKPKRFLKHGDEVEVMLEGVAHLKNTIKFENADANILSSEGLDGGLSLKLA